MKNFKSETIVFIHGLFMNPASWSEWIKFFEAKGYKCHAPAYPFHDGNPPELRENINQDLGKTTFSRVINGLTIFIDCLPEKPVLIGHSTGGLAVQKLIGIGKGVAGICIDPAPPMGIFSINWSFLKSNLPTVNPLKRDSVFLPALNWFHNAFCNTMTMEQTEMEFDRFVVPESRNIARTSAGSEGKVDFSKPHNPLLIIAGEKDNIAPSSLIRKNVNAYADKNSKTDFREFAGRSHYICGEQGWGEVAGYIDHWLSNLK